MALDLNRPAAAATATTHAAGGAEASPLDDAGPALLQASIAHWNAVLAGEALDRGPQNDPLCRRYFRHTCHGCPVRERTQRAGCAGTPQCAWVDHQEHIHGSSMDRRALCPECVELARRHVHFLRDLAAAIHRLRASAARQGALMAAGNVPDGHTVAGISSQRKTAP